MAEQTKQGAGNNDNVMAAVASLPLVGLIMFYAMPDASAMVKNYAKQSNVLLAVHILGVVLTFVVIGPLFTCVALILQIILIVKALQGDASYKLPLVGEFFDGLMK
jgi:uncharacterized membrane protein